MYNCNECGYKSVKWIGKCPLCGAWESFVEDDIVVQNRKPRKGMLFKKDNVEPQLIKEIKSNTFDRIPCGIEGVDRVLGGGLVEGEIILVGGEPGVGKSTLLLEVAAQISKKYKTLYVSAEESPQQIALRVKRLNADFENLYVIGEDDLLAVYEHVRKGNYKFVIIDSVQVVYCPECDGAKGSVSQIRGCADFLTHMAKTEGIGVFVVGHVTKDGIIAGPKLLEHIVDCVLYFEGEKMSHYRILRATKNRFGPTGDIVLFDMLSDGLKEISKTSDIFLPHKEKSVSGSSVACIIEGIRPMLVEVQALVSRASFANVRRRTIGFDNNRFSLLTAIIEKRLKLPLVGEDIFLNVAGGLRINDPAADLSAVVAVLSSFKEQDIPLDTAFIAEVGLAGEFRTVSHMNMRLKTVEQSNFSKCYIPKANKKGLNKGLACEIIYCDTLDDFYNKFFI